MGDGEIKKSPAIDEVIKRSCKIFLFILFCLAMFSPVATDIEFEIAQSNAGLEILFEYNDSHPQFIECVIIRNNCLPEEIPYLKLLEPPEKLSISELWLKNIDHSPLSLNIDQLFKEQLTDKKLLPSKVEYFITYIGKQVCSAQFLKTYCYINSCSSLCYNCLLCKIFDPYCISCIISLNVPQ